MTYSHDGPGNTSLKSFPLSLQHISRHDASSGWSKVRRIHLEVRGLLWSFLEDTYLVWFYASYGEGCQETWHHVLQIQFKHPYNNQLTILTPLRISIVHNIAIVAGARFSSCNFNWMPKKARISKFRETNKSKNITNRRKDTSSSSSQIPNKKAGSENSLKIERRYLRIHLHSYCTVHTVHHSIIIRLTLYNWVL